jgi:anti-sigma factor RsiW
MNGHLTSAMLSALADGELSRQELAQANEHLAGCLSCTAHALHLSLLKSATAKAGQRYAPPAGFEERVMRPAVEKKAPAVRSSGRFGMVGWAAAAVLLLVFATTMLVQREGRRADVASVQDAALVTEVFDQHVATLAGSAPPQVLSSDRHTVKPWFQGKIPFSFNLPEGLPEDVKLDGANLTYLNDQPVAQLLYSIGRHRVSVFVSQKASAHGVPSFGADHAGFHVMVVSTGELEMAAVSDVDPARLAELVNLIRRAQTGS